MFKLIFSKPSIHPLIHGLSARRFPMSLTSSLGEFRGYWEWLWHPALSPVLVSIAFPFAFFMSVFYHSLFFQDTRIKLLRLMLQCTYMYTYKYYIVIFQYLFPIRMP